MRYAGSIKEGDRVRYTVTQEQNGGLGDLEEQKYHKHIDKTGASLNVEDLLRHVTSFGINFPEILF